MERKNEYLAGLLDACELVELFVNGNAVRI